MALGGCLCSGVGSTSWQLSGEPPFTATAAAEKSSVFASIVMLCAQITTVWPPSTSTLLLASILRSLHFTEIFSLASVIQSFSTKVVMIFSLASRMCQMGPDLTSKRVGALAPKLTFSAQQVSSKMSRWSLRDQKTRRLFFLSSLW